MNGRSLTAWLMDAAAALITLLVLAWLLAAAGKGLDLTDEGFYLLTARHPEDVVMMTTSFHHVTAWLLWATGGSIIAIRVIAVLGTAAAGAALGNAALAVAGARRSWLAMSMVTMHALIAYVWLLLTPSYNTYNGWAVAGATVCTLYGFVSMGPAPSGARRFRMRWQAWMFCGGLFLGVSLFMKFPTAAAMGALVAFAIAAWPGLSGRRRAALVWMAFGAASTAVVMFLVVVSPRDWWGEMAAGLDQVARLDAGHGVSAIGRYARELWSHLGTGTRPVIWLLCALGFASAAVLAAARGGILRRAARVAIWLVLITAAVGSALQTIAWLFPPMLSGYAIRDMFPFWIARVHLHWGLLITAIAAGAAFGARSRGTDGPGTVPAPESGAVRKRVIVGLLLAGGTFAAAFGTANPIYLNFILALGSWSALLVLVVRYASARLDWSGAGNAAMLMILMLAAVQIVGGTVTASYGLNEGVLRQTVATSVGSPSTRLWLDPETHRLIVDMQRLTSACGFRDGDDLLAFYNVPGLVYALGGRSPGIPCFTHGLRGSRAVNDMGLEAAGAVRLSRAFILQTPESDPWLRTLAPLGIEFPARYTSCGTVTRRLRGQTSELTLWRPASIPGR